MAGKPLKYAGNGDFRRGTAARIINNLEMRMRRRRSALFFTPHEPHNGGGAARRTHTQNTKKAPETPV